ncbi:Protein kinase, putative [Hondaea fermentalgiana]|uniref:Protein kinase, putative n=1 Tax=Hondaea fermentalgiana TaxID=2315210 RepID=A0A2R5GQG2_9STRA|nr:Protein kinase, putative [Hondaea fermentalgiana]|eukprot:GBG33112.1 Protein kinase, putative [Hondaea fermentalgiana]
MAPPSAQPMQSGEGRLPAGHGHVQGQGQVQVQAGHRDDAVVRKATVALAQSYQQCSTEFKYMKSLNPRRALTKDCKGKKNNGLDNEANDLILIVNDVLKSSSSGCRYTVADMLGQGSFGQVAKCRVQGLKSVDPAGHNASRAGENPATSNSRNPSPREGAAPSKVAKLANDDGSPSTPTTSMMMMMMEDDDRCREEENPAVMDENQAPGNAAESKSPSPDEQGRCRGVDDEDGDDNLHGADDSYDTSGPLREGGYAAVKVIKNKTAYHNQALVETKILRLLNAEERALRGSERRRIVELVESFECKNHLCLVFEMLSMNLYDLIKLNKFRGLPMGFIRSCVHQILDALQVLARVDVVHCDLKPENILIESVGRARVKLIDFGSSCFSNQTVYTYIQSRFYRAPEVLVGMPYGPAIDMWSLGCVAAELYIGLPIFPGVSEHNQLCRIQETVGEMPTHLLDRAKETRKFYTRYAERGGARSWRLKSAKVWALEQRLEKVERTKRYVRQILLEDIVHKCATRADADDPSRPGRSERLAQVLKPWDGKEPLPTTKESRRTRTRESFLDFLRGLLQLDPTERWTAVQARGHPFVRNIRQQSAYEAPSVSVVNAASSKTAPPLFAKASSCSSPMAASTSGAASTAAIAAAAAAAAAATAAPTAGAPSSMLEKGEAAALHQEAIRSPRKGTEDDVGRNLVMPSRHTEQSPSMASVNSAAAPLKVSSMGSYGASESDTEGQAKDADHQRPADVPDIGSFDSRDNSTVEFSPSSATTQDYQASVGTTAKGCGIGAKPRTPGRHAESVRTPRHHAQYLSYSSSGQYMPPHGSPMVSSFGRSSVPSISTRGLDYSNRPRVDSDASLTPRSPYSMISPLSRPCHPYPSSHQASWDAMASGGYLGVDMRQVSGPGGMPVLPPNASIGQSVSSRTASVYAQSLPQSQFVPNNAPLASAASLQNVSAANEKSGNGTPMALGHRHRSQSMVDPRHSSYPSNLSYRWYPAPPFLVNGMPSPHQQAVTQHGFWAGSPPALSHSFQGADAAFALAQAQAQAQAHMQAHMQAQAHLRFMQAQQQQLQQQQQGSPHFAMSQPQPQYYHARSHSQDQRHHLQESQQYVPIGFDDDRRHSFAEDSAESSSSSNSSSSSISSSHGRDVMRANGGPESQAKHHQPGDGAVGRLPRKQQSSESSQELEMKLGAQNVEDEATLFKLSPELEP